MIAYFVLFLVVAVFLLHIQFAYEYMVMSYLDMREHQVAVSPFVLQFILLMVIAWCDICWMAVFLATMKIPFRRFLQMVAIILILFQIPSMMNHTITRFAPIKYVAQHFAIFVFVALLLVASQIISGVPKTTPKLWLDWAVPVAMIGSVMQVVIHYRMRHLYTVRTLRNNVIYKKWINKINIMEEYYLILTKHGKLKERPILTPAYCKIFQKQPMKPTASLLSPFKIIFSPKEQVRYFTLLGNIGYIAVVGKHVEIVLRGTQNLYEWAGNILGMTSMHSMTDNVGKHAEMNAQAHKLTPMILSVLDKYPGYPVYMAGHSRGSTMSLYLCQQLVRKTDPARLFHLILFAPPPLFDPRIRGWLRQHPNVHVETIILRDDVMAYLHRLVPLGTADIGETVILDRRPKPGKKSMCFMIHQKNGMLSSVFRKARPTWKGHRMDYYRMAV